jgi:nucleotide-binding universal stress UspA family protein
MAERGAFSMLMPEVKKILVPVAFAGYSQKSFQFSAYLADKTGADLLVLSVLHQRDIDAAAVYARLIGSAAISVDEFTKIEIDRRKSRIEEALHEYGLSELTRKIMIKVGNPFEEILKAIKELNIDLVVMGTRGDTKEGEYRIVTGSVAERVFKQSPVPVLSFRDGSGMEE